MATLDFFFSEITLPKQVSQDFFFSQKKKTSLFGIPVRFDSPKTSSYLAQLPSQQALKDFDAASGMLSNFTSQK